MSNADSLASTHLSRLRILIAEDNLINQKLTLRQLLLLDYEADLVTNGQAAVDAVKQFPYDVVLMDCQMPVLDGFAATIAIRQWEQQQQLPQPIVVIAMTASDLEHDRQRATAIGMNDYLIKPVRKETLATLLDRWSQVIRTNANSAESHTSELRRTNRASQGVPQEAIDPELLLPTHLDFSHLHRLCDNAPDFELELLQLFLQDSQSHLEALQQAIFKQDFQQIQQIAHHIKGASANVGAKMMQWLAEQLEHQTDSHPAPSTLNLTTAELIGKLEFSLNQVRALLNRMKITSHAYHD